RADRLLPAGGARARPGARPCRAGQGGRRPAGADPHDGARDRYRAAAAPAARRARRRGDRAADGAGHRRRALHVDLAEPLRRTGVVRAGHDAGGRSAPRGASSSSMTLRAAVTYAGPTATSPGVGTGRTGWSALHRTRPLAGSTRLAARPTSTKA